MLTAKARRLEKMTSSSYVEVDTMGERVSFSQSQVRNEKKMIGPLSRAGIRIVPVDTM